MVGIGQESAKRGRLLRARRLARAKRVEADDAQRVGPVEQSCVERPADAVVTLALDLDDRPPRRSGLLDKGPEIHLHDVIEEARHALIEAGGMERSSNRG